MVFKMGIENLCKTFDALKNQTNTENLDFRTSHPLRYLTTDKQNLSQQWTFLPNIDNTKCEVKMSNVLHISCFHGPADRFTVGVLCVDGIHLYEGMDFKKSHHDPAIALKYSGFFDLKKICFRPLYFTSSWHDTNKLFLHSLCGKVLQLELASDPALVAFKELDIPKGDFERAFQYNKETEQLLYISKKEQINVINVDGNKPVFSENLGIGKIAVKFTVLTPDFRHLIIASADAGIFVIDATTGKKVHKVDHFQYKKMTCMAALSDNIHIVVGLQDGTIMKITTEENTPESVVSMSTAHKSAVASIAVQNDSVIQRFASVNNGDFRQIIIWSGSHNLPLHRFHVLENSEIRSMQFLFEDNILFAGTDQGHIMMLKLEDEEDVLEKINKLFDKENCGKIVSHEKILEHYGLMDTPIFHYKKCMEEYSRGGGFDKEHDSYINSSVTKEQLTFHPIDDMKMEVDGEQESDLSSDETEPKVIVKASESPVHHDVFGDLSDDSD
uniref:ANAPC4_WD40 domain-containing protein n=1 Tax=Rhabditophanes sp. KR3021 TaxID=114890 RepID=A0AC35TH16_9BILA